MCSEDFEFDEDFEYIGNCCVCHDPVDFNKGSQCEFCGGVFHWSYCGSWHEGKHSCSNCNDIED